MAAPRPLTTRSVSPLSVSINQHFSGYKRPIPVIIRRVLTSFKAACNRHDFGYHNFRAQTRFTESNKLKIDDNFKDE